MRFILPNAWIRAIAKALSIALGKQALKPILVNLSGDRGWIGHDCLVQRLCRCIVNCPPKSVNCRGWGSSNPVLQWIDRLKPTCGMCCAVHSPVQIKAFLDSYFPLVNTCFSFCAIYRVYHFKRAIISSDFVFYPLYYYWQKYKTALQLPNC